MKHFRISLLLVFVITLMSCGETTVSYFGEPPSKGTPPHNRAPLADAGSDQQVIVETLTTLDASASVDYDGDPLTYSWSIESIPASSKVTLVDPGSETPSFIPDLVGEYVISLIVSDGLLSSDASIVTITVVPQGTKFWRTPQTIGTPSEGSYPELARGPTGETIAAWSAGGNIMVAHHTDEDGWGTPIAIESTPNNAYGAKVGFDASGNAIAIWHRTDGERYNVWANHYVAGDSWGPEQLVSSGTKSTHGVELAVSSSGRAMAVWKQSDANNPSIWTNIYSPLSGWGTEQLIENGDTGFALFPAVAIDSEGNAIVVWQLLDGSRLPDVWANRYDVTSGWEGEILLGLQGEGNSERPEIKIGPFGNAIAMWTQEVSTHAGMCAAYYTADAGWSEPALVDNTQGFALRPDIAFDSYGNAMAVWEQSNYSIWANTFSTETGWGTAQLLEDDTGYAISAKVAVTPTGEAIAVWQQEFDSGWRIRASNYNSVDGWGTPELLEEESLGQAASAPKIVIDPLGNGIAVWHYYTDKDYTDPDYKTKASHYR